MAATSRAAALSSTSRSRSVSRRGGDGRRECIASYQPDRVRICGSTQRAIGRRGRLQTMVFERAAKLVGGRGARHDDGAAARAPHIGMVGEATDGALESAKVRGSEKARLAGSNHRISGRRTAASMSSCALVNNIIDPAAAEDASHASCSSPDMAACLRVFTAVSARFTALVSSAWAGFSSSGTGRALRILPWVAKPVAKATSAAASEPGEALDVVEAALRSRHHVEDRRHASCVGAITRRALVPLIARQPKPAGRIELQLAPAQSAR